MARLMAGAGLAASTPSRSPSRGARSAPRSICVPGSCS